MIRLAVILACFAGPAFTQDVTSGAGAVLRALDKVSGEVRDVELARGATAKYGRLEINLSDCRFPAGNPSGDAFAYLTISDPQQGQIVFEGWMIASAPALNALDHARYDVWVLRCKTSGT